MNLKKVNQPMQKLLSNLERSIFSLPKKAEEFLKNGFRQVESGIFFESQFKENSLPSADFIKNAYADISGYEFSVNKLHLEDYCDSHCLEVGLLFIDEFVRTWKSQCFDDAIVLLSYYESEDLGEICTLQFHKKRETELVVDFDGIEDFSNPVLVLDTSFLAK